jgi:N-acetylglucosamine-6-sulfatase
MSTSVVHSVPLIKPRRDRAADSARSRWIASRPGRVALVLMAGGLIAAMLSVISAPATAHRDGSGHGAGALQRSHRPVTARTAARPPNIVFVLTDDLSMDLLRFMPQVQALQSRGLTFENYFVSDSLCCPSRSSIFTGNFPHDTGVFTNAGLDGGIGAFYAHGNEQNSFNVALHDAGYRTAMMGKYLNGYLQGPTRSPVPSTYVPPGWDQWDVPGYAYSEYNYTLNENGRLRHFGRRRGAYLTDLLARRGAQFVNGSSAEGKPFFLELATFAPHKPYTPARRDAHDFPGLQAPRPPSFNVLPTNAPQWLSNHPPLGAGRIALINRAFRRRVQSVQAVDDMLKTIQRALSASGQLRNTYIVFSSDNGLHTGEYRLNPGKLTAFDTDIHVPLVIAGPGVPTGASTQAMSENVDLAKTFEEIAGTATPSDGHSLLPVMSAGGETPFDWRNAILVEHHGPDLDGGGATGADPDSQDRLSGNPPSYEAVRTPNFIYVEYRDDEREFYDLRTDPYELHNVVSSLSATQLAQLHDELTALENCHTGDACWSAGHVAPTP